MAVMEYQKLIVERQDGIGVIRINHPDALNALNTLVLSELGKAFDPYNKKDFILKLNELLRQGILSEKARMEIIKWSEQHIHPNIAAQYLIDVIDAVENKKPLPPNIFW